MTAAPSAARSFADRSANHGRKRAIARSRARNPAPDPVPAEHVRHVARANLHWQVLAATPAGTACAVVFSGPHGYVSLAWYDTQAAVPTWNYAAVHVRGRACVHHGEAWLEREPTRLLTRFETITPERSGPAIRAQLRPHVVGLHIEIDSMTAKFKLSQNRPSSDTGDQALASFMRTELQLP